MSDASLWAAVGAGGLVGALLRWALLRGLVRLDPGWATLTANLLACALLGAVGSGDTPPEADPAGLGAASTLFWTTGLCGSLSTFSTLCADAFRQVRAGSRLRLAGILAGHLLGGPLAYVLGTRWGA